MSNLLFACLGAALAGLAAYGFFGRERRDLRGALARHEADLAAASRERDRLAGELKLLELATEGRQEAMKAENADLRRRMDELADEIMRVAGSATEVSKP